VWEPRQGSPAGRCARGERQRNGAQLHGQFGQLHHWPEHAHLAGERHLLRPDHEQLREVYLAWESRLSNHSMGARRLPELREKLFKVR
jgi:hypothetical protein